MVYSLGTAGGLPWQVFRGAPERGPGNYTSGRATELQICTSKLHTQKLQIKTESVTPQLAHGGFAALRKLWIYSFCLSLQFLGVQLGGADL
jgi:hypothetical protein